MNILSRMLNLVVARGMFGFHHKHRKIGLTHLSFADDLLIFCEGNIESVVGVLSVLEHFYEVSGLKLNSSKCEIFAAGIPLRTIEDLKHITGFQIGSMSVRYLGISLVTRKLTEKDCQALIDNIKHKLYHWFGRNLSYAGRLELIRYVLFNAINYWCRQVVLPASILKNVEQICSSNSQETMDHLFSQCSLEVGLWNSILNLNGMKTSSLTWDEMVSRASSSWKGRKEIRECSKDVTERSNACSKMLKTLLESDLGELDLLTSTMVGDIDRGRTGVRLTMTARRTPSTCSGKSKIGWNTNFEVIWTVRSAPSSNG
ncbi:uncharacterized protein LOC120130968 [Hibiscus syriacus]|uniref:uncharacterized protein LOC120130968 n=1 Tax=Hibiscus syriacus TaxID=106335 RepID=UPI001923B743|nr:uncharacterized protein LOC120130968 [Hibiscus syriacus]